METETSILEAINLFQEWNREQSRIILLLEDLQSTSMKNNIEYAKQSSERMQNLNEAVTAHYESLREESDRNQQRLEEYIKHINDAVESRKTTEANLTKALNTITFLQDENAKLNLQIDVLNGVLFNLSKGIMGKELKAAPKPPAGIEVNNYPCPPGMSPQQFASMIQGLSGTQI